MRGRPIKRPHGHRDEGGFTLVETMVVLVAFAVLIAISVPIVSTVMQTTSRVRATYTDVNDQLWLSTNLQRLLRAAVAPAPSFHGSTALALATPTHPRTPFLAGSITPTSLTFFANTGTAKGPEEVKASCTQTASHATLCAPTATFTLSMTPPNTTSCPFNQTLTTTCKWTSASARTLLSISHVTNGDSHTAQPLFTYTYGSTTVPSHTVSTKFSAAHCSKSSSGTAQDPFATCPAGAISEVAYELSFNAMVTKSTSAQSTPRNGGLQSQTVSGTYVMSSTTVLYSPAVG
jgi:prepilin-type N-terminal cleavage/methylation domain-containing protein